MSGSARSAALFAEAMELIPGGVSSPVRAFRSVGGSPPFIDRASGPCLFDADGNRYTDYVLSWGALALGHADPELVRAMSTQLGRGTSYGAPTSLETELARRIVAAVPSVEMVRFVSSGTEATMSAIRLARAATGRAKVLKFAGCYHGHADMLLVQAGSGVATFGLPDSPGVTSGAVGDTLVASYNDLASVDTAIEAHRDDLAAVIVEPVAGNMGLVLPKAGFLEGLRERCTRTGALLIFDEVMTGFRVAYGGAQSHFGIAPDLTCFGKVIGGGIPAAAYGGPRSLMRRIAPSGDVYQAGTLSGNPLAMVAGIATLDRLSQPGVYQQLEQAASSLASGMRTLADQAGLSVQAVAVGGMWGFFFANETVTDYRSARRADTARFAEFFHAALERGVYLPPSQFESAFVSTVHDEGVIEETLAALKGAFEAISG